MDTLALLCNLHADGPATLQRLRRAGFESVAALRALDPVSLAGELGWSERAAERFLREAALLCERLEPDEREEEREAEPEFELESTLLDELDGEAAAEESEAEDADDLDADEEDEDELAAALAPEPPAERVDAVLGAWRELDRVAPPPEPDAFEIPRPAPPADGELAHAGELPAWLVARLGELGIHSLRQLLERPELELARELPLAFTRLAHVRFQARRALERLPAPVADPRAARGFQPVSAPPNEPFETAGPFA